MLGGLVTEILDRHQREERKVGEAGQTVSDWIIEAKKIGYDLSAFFSYKREDIQKLRGLGVPVYDDRSWDYLDFTRENKELGEFLESYDGFTVRIIPAEHRKDLPRRYQVGVFSFEECERFFRRKDVKKVLKDNVEDYSVLLSEWEPQNASGVIFSKGEEVLIEITYGRLYELTGGKVNPDGHGLLVHRDENHKAMKYPIGGAEEKKLMWEALQPLRRDLPNLEKPIQEGHFCPSFNFMEGYFEFVRTKRDRIIFIDYKDNPAYLS